MLNRLFIIVGLIAILALAAAFILPGFIQWGDYRDRLQAIASETFGAPVAITGDIKFSLLPQPQFNFAKVVVGTAERPVMTIEGVEAQFSLVDFIRDRYAITRLVLEQPVIDLRVGEDGAIESGIVLAEEVNTSNISVANALIVDGTVRVADARSAETFAASNIDGELRMEALRGPFIFQGTADYASAPYGLRFATSVMSAEGGGQLNVSVRPVDESFSFAAEGALTMAAMPAFVGTMTYRQAPSRPAPDQPVDAGKGDFVITSKIEATPAKILLSEYTIIPDENRTGSRMLGAADVTLGKSRSFSAVISGAAMALPPRDATAENIVVPYELVRLLAELPPAPHPGLPGTIGVDIAEVNLRVVSLRNMRLDAVAQQGGWRIKALSGLLPGGTSLNLTGDLSDNAGKPVFAGRISLATERLDVLSQLWRKPEDDTLLFGVPGAFEADVSLVGETLSISNGVLKLDGIAHGVIAEIGFGSTGRHLNFKANLVQLNATDSAVLAALLPEMDDNGAFALTFPSGKFAVSAPGAVVYGLDGVGLAAEGSWEGGVIVADRIVAEDLGGASFDAKLTAFGSFEKPEVSGSATLQIGTSDAPVLDKIFELVDAPTGTRNLLRKSLPADLALRLDAPSGEGGQGFAASGRVGAAELAFDAKLGAGFLRALTGALSFTLDLKSGDAAALTAQLGLGDLSLTPDGEPVHAIAVVEGTPSASLEATLLVEGGGDSVGFAGNVVVTDPENWTGNGTVKVALTDFAALTDSLGAGGIDVPAVTGSAQVEFVGTSSFALDEIDASSGGQKVSGALSLSQVGDTRAVSGDLTIASFDPQGLLAVMVGRQALLPSAGGPWPNGPFSTGFSARTTTGRVTINAPTIMAGPVPLVTDAKFDLDWDATATRVRQFAGTVGGGQVGFDMAICCAGPLFDKQVNGRLTLTGVALDAIVPPKVGDALDGKVDAAAQFDGTGADLQAALAAMTGQGSYTLNDFRIERFDPKAFAAAAAFEDVLDADAEVLKASLVDKLDDAPFVAKPLSGSFSIAGGVIRSPNLAIEGDVARLFGSTSLSLRDLAVGGGFVMSPTGVSDPNSLVNEATAQIGAELGGTLPEPDRVFDVSGMIDAMKAKALELEVARLERLQAEDEARQKAAAEERARIAAEEARKKALEDAARQAAEKKAAEDAAKKKAAEDAAKAREAQQATDITGPLDLGLPAN